jgi:hypothetical protein
MALLGTLTGSRSITFTAIFAAMIAILDSIPTIPEFYAGVWDSWGFMLSPIVGILLGPVFGAISVGLGGIVGHIVYIRDPLELIFMIGSPLGAGMAGLVYEHKWQSVFTIYSLLLLGYFITPITWSLAFWGIWDILVGYSLVFLVTVISRIDKVSQRLRSSATIGLILATIIGLESDILARIFILIPGQTYWFLYGWDATVLQPLWMIAGIITPIKVTLAAIATVSIGLPLVRHFKEHNLDSDSQLTMN